MDAFFLVVDLVLLAESLETTNADTTKTGDTDVCFLVEVVVAMAICRFNVVFGAYETPAIGSRSFSIENSILFLLLAGLVTLTA